MNYNSFLIILTGLFSVAIIFTCIVDVRNRKRNLIISPILSLALYLAFLFLQYALKLQINAFVILLLLIAIIGDHTLGYSFDLYNRSTHYDRYLHAFGTFSFALFFYLLLSQLFNHFALPIAAPKLYTAIFVSTIGISLGCIFEIVEFISDSKSKGQKHPKHQRGLRDTNFDLISDVIGAVLAGVCSLFTR